MADRQTEQALILTKVDHQIERYQRLVGHHTSTQIDKRNALQHLSNYIADTLVDWPDDE